MATPGVDRDSSTLGTRLPRAVAIVGGVGFIALGVWAMVNPRSFFAALATFEPYNQQFLQDVGAFQMGLGVVLLLAGVPGRADGLTVALVGVGVGAAFHTVSHVVGRDLGGTPSSFWQQVRSAGDTWAAGSADITLPRPSDPRSG